MAQTAHKWESEHPLEGLDQEQTEKFLTALTELSQDYGIGITGEACLFTMERGVDGDDEKSYRMDKDSRLSFV